jgi:hypothetical protein
MKSPDGYDWYYECTADGQHFMLGLYHTSDPNKAIDPLMPVLSTNLPDGRELTVPGAGTEEAIAQFHAK